MLHDFIFLDVCIGNWLFRANIFSYGSVKANNWNKENKQIAHLLCNMTSNEPILPKEQIPGKETVSTEQDVSLPVFFVAQNNPKGQEVISSYEDQYECCKTFPYDTSHQSYFMW